MILVHDIYHVRYFLQKEELVLLLEGGYFQGDRYFQDLLTLVTFYRYFRRFATFKGLLLLELYGS